MHHLSDFFSSNVLIVYRSVFSFFLSFFLSFFFFCNNTPNPSFHSDFNDFIQLVYSGFLQKFKIHRSLSLFTDSFKKENKTNTKKSKELS